LIRTVKLLVASVLALALLAGCSKAVPVRAPEHKNGLLTISLAYQKQTGYASNQFAVWVEDDHGAFVKTLYATRFTASGGYKTRPDAIPTWVERSGLADKTNIDAFSGATPKSGQLQFGWDLTDENGERVPDGTYRYFVEGSLRWENRVLYSGEIALSAEPATSAAEAQYTYEASSDAAALTDDAPENGMISSVSAQYTPPQP
jgi:hypothetical protein